jgi:hypothetical protein
MEKQMNLAWQSVTFTISQVKLQLCISRATQHVKQLELNRRELQASQKKPGGTGVTQWCSLVTPSVEEQQPIQDAPLANIWVNHKQSK